MNIRTYLLLFFLVVVFKDACGVDAMGLDLKTEFGQGQQNAVHQSDSNRIERLTWAGQPA
jgi:hypothetical protein